MIVMTAPADTDPASRSPRPRITTEPFPASRKIYVEGTLPGVRVPDAGDPGGADPHPRRGSSSRTRRSRSTTPPGPTPTRRRRSTSTRGLSPLRRDWIDGRGDVEELASVSSLYGRAARGGSAPRAHPLRPRRASPCGPSRAATSPRCTTRARGSSPPRWSSSPSARTSAARCPGTATARPGAAAWPSTRGRPGARRSPPSSPPNSCATRWPAAGPSSRRTSTTRRASR